jgi:hypothetical protein
MEHVSDQRIGEDLQTGQNIVHKLHFFQRETSGSHTH